jgi:hypothetical protein
VQRRLLVWCNYSENGMNTVLKFVARIRLIKTENPSVCITVKCKACRLAIRLYILPVVPS